jgi:hypothetical protein
MTSDLNHSKLLQFVKNDLVHEKNNYSAIIIKALIESGFNDEIRSGKSSPYAANPPVLSTEEIHKKIIQANLGTPNFDVNDAVNISMPILKPFVTISSNAFSLTLEFNAKEIPEILKICDQKISLK